jgi:hypothetical protein
MMATKKPKAISTEEFIRSATMFYMDKELEKSYSDEVQNSVNSLSSKLEHINTRDGLKKYIRDDKNSLDNVTSILNISTEKFKRIITMLRLEKGHMPTTEWSLSKTRTQMIEKPEFMDEVCELLMNGANLPRYKELIPEFYLENFTIGVNTIARLANPDDVRRLIKKGLDGRYNNNIGDSFFKFSSESITRVFDKTGLTYSIKKDVPLIGRPFSLAIPNENTPRILIDISYNITTSSAQTDYAKQAEETASILRQKNEGKPESKKIIFVNILDGAGWVARRSDLEKIQRCSDYLINLKTLTDIDEIINYYL